MKQDYYDGLIQERGRSAAAPLLADECRKADVEIAKLRDALKTMLRYTEASDGKRGDLAGSAVPAAAWHEFWRIANMKAEADR